jgi:hypothetical protein
MKKVTVKNLIDFRLKSDKSKKTFVSNIKIEKVLSSESDSGGNYWVTSLSAIGNSYRHNDLNLLNSKIEELREKIASSEFEKTKNQFQRNIEILERIKDIDLQDLKPDSKVQYLKQPKSESIIDLGGLPIQANPRFIFTYDGKNDKEVGGIWFVAKLEPYTKEELGMYCEVIFEHLSKTKSKDYFVNPAYCICLDASSGAAVTYQDIIDGNARSLISSTIEEFKKF